MEHRLLSGLPDSRPTSSPLHYGTISPSLEKSGLFLHAHITTGALPIPMLM